ncbi:MAG TPA: hypothetical protein VFZ10_17710, partial [Geminicoccaceae bacterium]
VSVIALGGAVLAGASEHLANVLWALAAGNLGASWIELAMLGLGGRCAHRRRSFARYREIWRHVRWAVVGAGTSILQQQAHSLLISITTGPAAYAPIAAGAILLSPVRIGIQAWHMVMRPELAVAIARGERRSVTWMLMLSMGVLTLGTLLVAAAVFLFWAPIETLLYRERYEDQPMAWIVAGWIAITLCSALSTGPSSALQAFKSFRILALATVVGSAVSLAAVGCILLVWPPAMTLAGVLLAQTFTLVFLLRVTWKRMAALHDSARGG